MDREQANPRVLWAMTKQVEFKLYSSIFGKAKAARLLESIVGYS